MAKNTGMNAKDEKAGKTAKLSPAKAKDVNQLLEMEKKAPPPTKTVAMVTKAREKKKNK
ncbi:MAG: hypothetical protein ABI416_08725 [Ginsengibacter sp.]